MPCRIHGLFACENGFLAWGEKDLVRISDKGSEIWRGTVRLRAIEAICDLNDDVFAVDSSGSVARFRGRPEAEWDGGLSRCAGVGELRCASLRKNVLAGGDAFGRLATCIDGHASLAEPLHGGVVTSVRWSSSRESLCSTSDDRGVRCWRIVSSSVLELDWCGLGHSARVWDATFCSGDRTVASCGQDAEARTWNSADGSPIRVFKAHSGKHAWCVATSDGVFATGGSDSTVRVWPTETNDLDLALPAPAAPTAIRFVSTTVILVACDTGTLWRVDVDDDKNSSSSSSNRWTQLAAHPAFAAKCLEPRGGLVAACGASKGWVAVSPVSSSSSEGVVAWQANNTRALGCWWLSDDELLVSSADRTIAIWSRRGEKLESFAAGNSALAIDVAVHPTNPLLFAVGDSRGRVTRFDRRLAGSASALPRGPRASAINGISALAWVGDGLRCLAKDARVIYLNEDATKRLADVPVENAARTTRPPRPSKPNVAGGFYEDRNFVVFDVETGRRMASLVGTSSNRSHDFYADDDCVALAACANGNTLSYSRTSTRGSRDIGPFLVADGVAAAQWVSPNRIVCSGGSGQLATYSASRNVPIARIRRLSPAVHAERAIAVTSKGIVATASKHELRIWDPLVVPTSSIVLGAPSPERQDQRVLAICAWHDDSLFVALGDSAGLVTICDDRRILEKLQYDASPVLSLSRQNDRLFAGSTSGVLVAWRLSDYRVVFAVQAHLAGVNALCSAPAASTNTSTSRDNDGGFLGGGILVATGGDDHALATLVLQDDGQGAKFERVPRDTPAPVVGLGLSPSSTIGTNRRLYVVSTDLRLCAFDIADDATLFDRRPTWRVAASFADSLVISIPVLSIDLDLGDVRGLHVAPSSSHEEESNPGSQQFDRILVYGEGGLAIASCRL